MNIGDELIIVERFMCCGTPVTSSRGCKVVAVDGERVLLRIANFGSIIEEWFDKSDKRLQKSHVA